MARPPQLSPKDAKEKILLKLNEGKFELSFHCRYESMPKRKIKQSDILNVLERGEIRREPEWSEKHQNWKYRVEGFDIENEKLTAITVILDLVLVVTAF
jgi:hypothetical protein